MAEELRIRIEGEIPEGAETSPVRARFTRDEDEDAEGQMPWKYLKPVEDEDAEGQMPWKYLKPVEDEDAEGQMPLKYLEPVGDEEAEGNVLHSHVLEIERDENGELVGRFVPAEGDDTEGQAMRGN
jgi:hypothetical protein